MSISEFEKFLEQYEKDIYSFCRHLAMDSDIGWELYQETALAAFEMRGKINLESNPKSLLLSIAAGKWKNMRRKAARRQDIAPEVQLDLAWNAAEKSTTESEAERKQRNRIICKALSEIKDKFRIPLILHYFDDMPTEAIGRVLKIPAGTVKSRLFKGRELLKKSLTKEGISYG